MGIFGCSLPIKFETTSFSADRLSASMQRRSRWPVPASRRPNPKLRPSFLARHIPRGPDVQRSTSIQAFNTQFRKKFDLPMGNSLRRIFTLTVCGSFVSNCGADNRTGSAGKSHAGLLLWKTLCIPHLGDGSNNLGHIKLSDWNPVGHSSCWCRGVKGHNKRSSLQSVSNG
jgi:hypothetical protein